MDLDAVFQWKMTPVEAEVFKLACVWVRETSKMFPREDIPKLPVKGDPRKSYLFKHCWRFHREVRGLLKPDDVPLYIHAQLFAMKAYKGRVDPNILCGDKAWLRWKLWKRAYDEKVAERENLPPPPQIRNIPLVAKELILTKKFLFEKCEGEVTKEKLDEFVNSGFFKLWVGSGKVSAYYLVLSPLMKPHLERLQKECGFDPRLIADRINKDVEAFFEKEFEHELLRG